MAFAATVTFLSIVIIVTMSATRLHDSSTIGFLKTDNFHGPIPGNLLKARSQEVPTFGIENAVQLNPEEAAEQAETRKLVQKRGGQAAMLDLMDFGTKHIQVEKIAVPAVILRKEPKTLSVLWIWRKIFFGKK